jgi:hypothetical protein
MKGNSNTTDGQRWQGTTDACTSVDQFICIVDPPPAGTQPVSCSSPEGAEGDLIYNTNQSVLQFCNGSEWVPTGPVPGTGGAGCSNPDSNTVGLLVYNEDFRVMQYCDGSDWVAIGKPSECTQASCGGDSSEKVVFVTQVPGNASVIGGVAGADEICRSEALEAGLSGSYKAWIADSDPNSAPATRFTQASVPYVNVKGDTIASDWADLIDGTLSNDIIFSEEGRDETINGVWTNVLEDGTQDGSGATFHCNDWTAGSSGDSGSRGHKRRTNSSWTNDVDGVGCHVGSHIYCFEQ